MAAAKTRAAKTKGSKDKGCKKKDLLLDWTAVDISGTKDFVLKTTDSIGDSQIFDDGTFVGIGTTTDLDAQNILGVAGRAAFDFGSQGVVRLTTPGGNPGIVITRTTPLTDPDRFDMAHLGSFFRVGYVSDAATPTITIAKGATPGSGRVGMGTSNPDSDTRLHVFGVTRNNLFGVGTVAISTPAGRPGMIYQTPTGATDRFDTAHFGSFYGLGFNNDWLGLNSNRPTVGIKKGATAGAGRVGIGTSTPSGALHVSTITDTGGSATPGHGVTIDSGDVAGNARIELRDGQGGANRTPYIDFSNDVSGNDFDMRIILTGDNDLLITGGTLTHSSDERLKANIETIANPLDKVLALRGVTYNWRGDTSINEGTHIGVVAQEVEMVLPEVVSTGPDGYKGVSYNGLVGVLVEALKEQQTQIDALEARLAELETR